MSKLNAMSLFVTMLFAAVLVIYIARLRHTNDSLRSDKKALTAQLEMLTTQYELTEQAYQALAETKLQIRTQTRTVVKRIKASPSADNAPLAPVLKSALEALP